MTAKAVPVGVLTLERRDGPAFPADLLAQAEALAALLGPLLDLKRRQHRWVSGRLVDLAGEGLRAVLGPERPSLKLGLVVGATALAALALVDAPWRVGAEAVLEGEVQRAAVAPFAGFVATAPARAGDLVRAGDVLATLDDRDLELDLLRAQSERQRLVQRQRDTLARHERAETAQLAAQIRQTEAEIALAQEKLLRATITAPIDGLVVTGDLSQLLGSPIEAGETLFEIAPQAGHRVVLQVDERDIRHVRPGQTGSLALAGRPSERLAFTVARVTAVATATEGRNGFRVEARLDEEAPGLRPGLEGVGKIEIGAASLLWSWTRRLVEWARFQLWAWTP
jgi:multidrug efflux pump subunit AcrA (membrane-fusion protein)